MPALTTEQPVESTPTLPIDSPLPGRVRLSHSGLEAIYEENARPIYYLALRMLGDPTQAEDATHDVFLKAYRKLADFKGNSSVRTWLYRITINRSEERRVGKEC